MQADTNACPTAYSFGLSEIEDIRETTSYEVNASGGCVASAQKPAEFYLPGERIDLTTLPVLEELVVGTGEVRALFSGFGGIPYLPLARGGGPLVDESGRACQPFEAPDGTLRCVPSSFAATARLAFRYEDDSCSGAPVVPWLARPTCNADAPLPSGVVLVDETVKCPQGLSFLEARAVAGKSRSSTLYAKDAITGACEPTDPPSSASTYLILGETLGPTALPEIERTLRQ